MSRAIVYMLWNKRHSYKSSECCSYKIIVTKRKSDTHLSYWLWLPAQIHATQHSTNGAAAESNGQNASLFDPVTDSMHSGGADYRATSAAI